MAVMLRRAGVTDITIYEKAQPTTCASTPSAVVVTGGQPNVVGP
jgi:hypothetical protein